MSSQPDYVVVDDTQREEIKYSSGWIETNFSSSVGNTGPPLYQTLHVAMSPANFTFTYNGATGPLFIIGSILSDSTPMWSCTLDSKPMLGISNGIVPGQSNHVRLCSFDSQTAIVGDHVIQVSVAASQDNLAYFDYILYTPTSAVVSGDFFLEPNNSAIQYGGQGWKIDGNDGVTTSGSGDSFSVAFRGHTVLLVGSFDGSQGRVPADATFSIDGSTPVGFTLSNPANGATVLTEQIFFQTPSQGPGPHHLQIVYHGEMGSTPLTLDHLIIQNSTIDFELTPVPGVIGDASQSPIFSNVQTSKLSTSTGNVQATTVSIKSSTVQATTLRFLPSTTIHQQIQPSNGRASHSGKVMGISIGVLGVVFVGIAFGCLVWRAWKRTSGLSSRSAHPFPSHNRLPPVPKKERQQPSINTFPDVERQSPATSSRAPTSKARRLAEVTAATLRRYRSRSRSRSRKSASELISPNTSVTTGDRPSRIVMHQDSGVPLGQPAEEDVEVIDVPPAYASIT